MSLTFIFLHGGPGFKDYLEPYFNSLEKKFTCVFYDQVRGSKVQIKDQVDQLNDFVQESASRVVLVGHSWGGVLATQYASLYSEKLAGLVLISTGLNTTQWKDEFRAELKSLDLEDAPPENIFLTSKELELGKPLLDSTWEGFSEETFDSLDASFLGDYDLTNVLAKLHIPILNVYGQKDIRFPTRVAKSFRKYNRNLTDLEISDAGHFPFLLKENRDKIIKLIETTFAD